MNKYKSLTLIKWLNLKKKLNYSKPTYLFSSTNYWKILGWRQGDQVVARCIEKVWNLLGISLLLILRLCVTYKLKGLLSISKRNKKVDLMETHRHLHQKRTLGTNQTLKEDKRKERSTLHNEKRKEMLVGIAR